MAQLVKKKKVLLLNGGDTRDSGLIPGSGQSPWRRKWQPTLVFLPRKSDEQRNLVGYRPWSHKELDTTEHSDINKRKIRTYLFINY